MKRFAAALVAVALTLGGAILTPLAAHAAVTINGTVTRASDATPIVGASLEFSTETDSWSAFTNLNGEIISSAIPVGTYTLKVSAQGYAPVKFPNVSIVDGSNTFGLVLQVESTISGVIRDYNGNLLNDVFVYATSLDGSEVLGQGFTDALGAYTIVGLAQGDVKVLASTYFTSDLSARWYVSSYTLAGATVLAVPAPGGNVVADIVLPLGATVAGTVLDPIGSAVNVSAIATGAGLDYNFQGGTNNSGEYTLRGLPPQSYSVTTGDYWGLFAPAAPQTVNAVAGATATANFTVTPALVAETEFVDQIVPTSGPTTVEAGKTYTWVVDVQGDTNVYAILYSDPVYLGAAARDGAGPVSITLTIPADTPIGAHKLTFSSFNDAGEGSFLAREFFPITVGLPSTGGGDSQLFMPVGALFLLLGAGAVAWNRRASRA